MPRLQSLSFGAGGTLTFAMGTKGALTINNIPYTPALFDGSTANGINGDLGGHFALANDLASTGTFTGAVVAPNATSAFTGVFEGLGHTISNLTIKDPTGSANDGLFGVSSGTIRDVGLINASVSNSGSGSTVGSLVGSNDGSILNLMRRRWWVAAAPPAPPPAAWSASTTARFRTLTQRAR